ncbi:DUF4157 domain-containing protein [Herbaspirillum sp. RV1423]|uniref:eCIS core domain-containing protein n=1 Tax=Herbaspirillum sp. RV1423 TaxID=1443993 RepID=UPI0004ADF096|nr:DUF4157 domain-containing protein [Herbaspirillum sp. RV1423]
MKSRLQAGTERTQRAAARSPAFALKATGKNAFVDNRPAAAIQRMLQEAAGGSSQAMRHGATEDGAPLQAKEQPAEDEEPVQGRFAATAPVQLAQQEKSKANHTGLPDHLKSGIENLSGMSMDHVKVHYNSSEPAQLNAHAYAQGSDIHVAPGQEQHLPHEAWHVVQQAQGRVRPTMQMKGAAVNDDATLEEEADLMGTKAASAAQRKTSNHAQRFAATSMPGRQPVQLARYLKSIQNPGDMDNEVLRLTHASPLDTNTFGGNDPASWNNRPIDLNRWLAGGAGNSVTHYNPGQNQYYSPVGYIVEVAPADVLGNYAGDGSTSTLNSDNARYWQAVEAIRGALTADLAINAAIDGNGYTANFAAPVTDKATAIVLTGRIEHFLANGGIGADVKAAAKVIIKAQAKTALIGHYSNTGNYPLGPGGPAPLAPLEAHLQGLAAGTAYHNPAQGPHGRDIKYTESQVHAELAHVVGTFYATELGSYPVGLINAAWLMGDPAWLNNRRSAADQFKQKFATAGNRNVAVMSLSGGALAAAAPSWGTRLTRGFLRWALPAVGVAVVAYASLPYLQQLFGQYLAANQGGAE